MFPARQRAVMERMGPNWLLMSPSPRVKDEELARTASELAALVASMPASRPLSAPLAGITYGSLRWLRRPDPELVLADDHLLSPLDWLARGEPEDVIIEFAESLTVS